MDIINNMLTHPQMNQDQLAKDFGSQIYLLDASKTPLYSLLAASQSFKPAKTTKFSWVTDMFLPDRVQPSENNADVSTESNYKLIKVDNRPAIRPNDILMNDRTGETMFVKKWTSIDKQIEVIRGFGGGIDAEIGNSAKGAANTIASILTTDVLIQLGNINALGSDTVMDRATTTTTLFNYCQIFKDKVMMDNTTIQHAMEFGVDEFERQREKTAISHLQSIERALLFGRRGINKGTLEREAYSMGGLFQFVTSNVETVGNSGTLSYKKFREFCSDVAFKHGSDEKFMFTGSLMANAFADWYGNNLTLNPTYAILGVHVPTFITSEGKRINIIVHEMFKQIPSLNGTALFLDGEDILLRPYRHTRLKENILAYSNDARADEFLTEIGLQVTQEKRHAILKGITSYE